MIGRINGKLLEKQAPELLVDVQGVGYEILVSMNTFFSLPGIGDPVVLHNCLASPLWKSATCFVTWSRSTAWGRKWHWLFCPECQ